MSIETNQKWYLARWFEDGNDLFQRSSYSTEVLLQLEVLQCISLRDAWAWSDEKQTQKEVSPYFTITLSPWSLSSVDSFSLENQWNQIVKLPWLRLVIVFRSFEHVLDDFPWEICTSRFTESVKKKNHEKSSESKRDIAERHAEHIHVSCRSSCFREASLIFPGEIIKTLDENTWI
jgi:hypothetical protein